jgi:hypothetical protein
LWIGLFREFFIKETSKETYKIGTLLLASEMLVPIPRRCTVQSWMPTKKTEISARLLFLSRNYFFFKRSLEYVHEFFPEQKDSPSFLMPGFINGLP